MSFPNIRIGELISSLSVSNEFSGVLFPFALTISGVFLHLYMFMGVIFYRDEIGS